MRDVPVDDFFRHWASTIIAAVMAVIVYVFRHNVVDRIDANMKEIRQLDRSKADRVELERCIDRMEKEAKEDRHDIKEFLQAWVTKIEHDIGHMEGRFEAKLTSIEKRLWDGWKPPT